MKSLPTEFTFDGCHFRQLARDGDVVLLARTPAGHRCSSYEVAIIQHHLASAIHGREYPERESMPPSASWGSLGWSHSDLPSAHKRFDALVTGRVKLRLTLPPFPATASQAVGGVIYR